MSFEVDIGYSSQRGPRERNEDFAGARARAAGEAARGLIAAIADGVSHRWRAAARRRRPR